MLVGCVVSCTCSAGLTGWRTTTTSFSWATTAGCWPGSASPMARSACPSAGTGRRPRREHGSPAASSHQGPCGLLLACLLACTAGRGLGSRRRAQTSPARTCAKHFPCFLAVFADPKRSHAPANPCHPRRRTRSGQRRGADSRTTSHPIAESRILAIQHRFQAYFATENMRNNL